MKITLGKEMGTVKLRSGLIKEYRQAPGDYNAACYAAAFYAHRDNEDMVVISGNSYGSKVFHIARATESLTKFTAVKITDPVNVTVAQPDGKVFKATAIE